ncbi:NB-ARC and TPR domain [Fusarium albosuccineum]|uniref:NB-ARC and TPR domain n=1 Tax=Fusarium albosuccineum TaxID=1237068 RepID=A0A8H4P8L2_9HYPO|nr:NB-ARC and TPR domain [Fusarium albosuccineum]
MIETNEDHHTVCKVAKGSRVFDEVEEMIKDALGRHEIPEMTPEADASSDVGNNMLAGPDSNVESPSPNFPFYYRKSQPRNPDFFGRKDVLDKIDDVLLPSSNQEGLRVFSLSGMPGLGKTQIALEYVFSREAKFDAIFWLSADKAVKIEESFSEIAIDFPLLSRDDAKDVVLSRNAVLDWLSRPFKVRPEVGDLPLEGHNLANWLVVMDNLDSPVLFRDYMTMHGDGAVLITSRDPFSKHYSGVKSGVDLEPFDPETADKFLQHLTYESKSNADKSGSREVSFKLGGLPIALAHASGVIKGKFLTFHEFLKSYQDGKAIYGNQDLVLSQVGPYHQTLATVFALESLAPAAQRLIEVLSFLDPDSIPEAFIAQDPGSGVVEFLPSADDYMEIRSQLIKASLIKRNTQERTLSIHRVVQDVARVRLPSEEFRNIFALTTSRIDATWVEDREHLFGHRMVDWQEADKIIPHLLAISIHYKEGKPVLTNDELSRFASLVNRASIYLKERNNWDLSLELARVSLDILEAHQKDDMAELYADILMSLASTHNALGNRVEGLKYAREHFQQRLYVEDNKGVNGNYAYRGMAYTQMAVGLLTNHRYTEAIHYAEAGREILEKAPEYRQDTYWPHWAYWYHAWGLIGLEKPEEARPLLLKTLQWRERHYGADDTESMKTAFTLQILGVIEERVGHLDDAVRTFERSLRLFDLTEGPSSFRANQVRVKLGNHYGRLGKPEAAKMMFDTALKYFTGKPYYKAERARTFYKQSEFLASLGEANSAFVSRQEATKLYDEICPEHKKTKTPLSAKNFDDIVMIMSR